MPVPVEFILFGLTLLGVMLLHGQHLKVAFGGLFAIIVYKLLFDDMSLVAHFEHEAMLLLNLLGLLVGFELMAEHFQKSHLAKMAHFPSITGNAGIAPKLPKPNTADPSEITATIFRLIVYSRASFGCFAR